MAALKTASAKIVSETDAGFTLLQPDSEVPVPSMSCGASMSPLVGQAQQVPPAEDDTMEKEEVAST